MATKIDVKDLRNPTQQELNEVAEKLDINIDDNHRVCANCGENKHKNMFYKSYTPKSNNGFLPYCKDCCYKVALGESGKFTREGMLKLCLGVDKPFREDFFITAENSGGTDAGKVGEYLRLTNAPRVKGQGFQLEQKKAPKAKGKVNDEDMELWGADWQPEEYRQLNELYNEYLNNYPLRTAMHKRALVKICKLQLRSDAAIAQNNTADAKYWGDLLSKAQVEAKFNPSQLSAADLSDGISSFSKIAEAVEREIDIIPVLPQYKQRPQDAVDYTIWQYINYVRRLQNLPEVNYVDLYKYLTHQYEKHHNVYKFLRKEDNGRYDERKDGDL